MTIQFTKMRLHDHSIHEKVTCEKCNWCDKEIVDRNIVRHVLITCEVLNDSQVNTGTSIYQVLGDSSKSNIIEVNRRFNRWKKRNKTEV